MATFLVYSLFAGDVPGPLVGRELTISRLVEYVGFDPSAVFSTPLAVGTTIVVLFVLFGNLLFAAENPSGWIRREPLRPSMRRHNFASLGQSP